MSITPRSKKIKPINPEEQPVICQFIVESAKPQSDSDSPECKGKKQRRSTGGKSSISKRCNSTSDATAEHSVIVNTEETTDCNEITRKMIDIQVEEESAANTMLTEIMRMEERLTAKITSSKREELSEMEKQLKNNIKSTIDTSIKDAIKVMQTLLNKVVDSNPTIHSHSLGLKDLKDQNTRLNQKVQQLTTEQGGMKKQLNKMENMALEHLLIVKGIQEELKETEQMICDKVHIVLLKIMQGDTEDQKLANAKQISIKSIRRLGRFSKHRIRPLSKELHHKQDIEYILENRYDLEQGIYVDREYPMDIERKRKTLLPVLRAAKRSSEFEKHSRLEDDKIVLKGLSYSVNTLNQLPEELNIFKVMTRETGNVVGFFGEINPLSNFYPAAFAYDGVHYISSEQFIQSHKAKFFGDVDMYNQIMGCTTS